MEKMRNKDGKVISYREKVYVDGKAITKTFKRKSDALSWKRNFLLEQQRKEALGIEDIQSIDFKSFAKLWLEMKENQDVAPRTIDAYYSTLERYLKPVLGKTKLEKITPRHAQKIIQLATKKGSGTARINFHLRLLKLMLNDGVRLNYLVRSPIADVKLLKERPKSLKYWVPQEIAQFLTANRDDLYYPLYVLALNTGLRRGELLGLCWDKVDLKRRKIEISRVRDRYGLKDTTKTSLIRYVPLNQTALTTLEELAINKRHPSFVFICPDQTLPDISHFSTRTFQKAVKRAGVPRIRFHDLRTTYASNFVMAGGDIFSLSKILGHTSVEMTAKRYAALHPKFMEGVADVVQFDGKLSIVKESSPYLAQIS